MPCLFLIQKIPTNSRDPPMSAVIDLKIENTQCAHRYKGSNSF